MMKINSSRCQGMGGKRIFVNRPLRVTDPSADASGLCGARLKNKNESNPLLEETLLPARADDKLELWSFVLKKSEKRWLWNALCPRTRQIVAHVIGDRSVKTCRKLWALIPDEYKAYCSFSDFWDAYEKVFPKETHRSVCKETGKTSHMERWNNTLQQSNARYVRKTLSFSKSDFYHALVTRVYIVRYNLAKASLIT